MKRLFSSFFMAFVLLTTSTFANGLNLNSVGAKAGAMGGAFIGLADDYSAIFWNPAGISQVQNFQLAAYYCGVMPSASYKNSQLGIDAKTETQTYSSPGIMAYVPIDSGFISFGLGVYIPSGLGTTWNGDDFKNLTGGNSYEWMSKIGVINIAPALSIKLLPSLSLGAAFNLSYGFLDLKRPQYVLDPKNRQPIWGQYSESSSGWGFGGTFGLLFKPINLISIGATFRTANTIAFSGTAENDLLKAMMGDNYRDADLERDIQWPIWYGAGIALRPLGFLTITADIQYTNWKSLDTLDTKYTGWEAAGVTEGKMNMSWKSTMQIRFGAEANLFDFLAIRAGYYIDPAPAPDETLNILFPSIDYSGITFGLAFEFSHLTIEGSVEYLMGKERTITTQTMDNMAGVHNNDILAFWAGVVFDL